jgi:hypothetical protein
MSKHFPKVIWCERSKSELTSSIFYSKQCGKTLCSVSDQKLQSESDRIQRDGFRNYMHHRHCNNLSVLLNWVILNFCWKMHIPFITNKVLVWHTGVHDLYLQVGLQQYACLTVRYLSRYRPYNMICITILRKTLEEKTNEK